MTDVAIEVAGQDVTDRVLFSSARFVSQVNGTAGDFYLRLRDPDRTLDFPTGAAVACRIDGDVAWRGFMFMWERVYVFPALDVDAFGETRFFDMKGSDLNVLFNKRFVFNQSSPTTVAGKLYPPFQADDEVIADLVADYLDLSGDDIDTSTFVENVGDITEDQEGRAWSAGDSWGQAMQSIAMLPAAIFYLAPTNSGGNLVYTDVDTPNAPYAMSDVGPFSGSGGGGGGGDCAFLDEWDRIESGTWGTSTDGHEWFEVGGGSATLSVDGTNGFAANGTLDQHVLGSQGDEKWATSFIFETIVRFDTAIGVGDYIDFTFNVNDSITDIFHQVYVFFANPADEPSLLDVTDSATSEVEIGLAPPDTDIHVKWEFTPGGLNRAKVWWSGPEPDWLVSRTDGNTPQTNDQDFRIRSTSATDAETVSFGSLEFCSTTPPPTPAVAQYREMEILNDGTGLVNDQLAWGIGYGSNEPVFVRDTDGPSQALHGLWQAGTVRYGIYKQATINRVAASIVDGSPQSKRGAKIDRIAVMVTTYVPGFLPAQKVDFTSEVWGFNDVIPIRKMEITFEAPENPKFALTLSHEIDTPFGFFDPFLIDFRFPPFPPIPPFPPFPGDIGCTPMVCGITDDFQRTEASDFGVATCLINWGVTGTIGSPTASVNGSEAEIVLPTNAGTTTSYTASLGGVEVPINNADIKVTHFRIDGDIVAGETGFQLIFLPMDTPGVVPGPNILIAGAGSRIRWVTGATGTLIPAVFWNSSSTYTWTVFNVSGTTWRTEVTDGVNTYSVDQSVTPTVARLSINANVTHSSGGGAGHTVWFTDVDIPEITRCSLNRFDNFDRSEASDWGVASSGAGWALTTSSNAVVSVVPGFGKIELNSSGGSAQAVNEALAYPNQWWGNSSFDMLVSFQTDNVANTGTLRFLFFEGTFASYRGVDLLVADNEIGLLNAAGSTSVPYSDWSDDEPMMLRFRVQGGAAIKARVWKTSDPEPSAWNVELVEPDATIVPMFRVEADDNSLSSDSVIVYSYIDFEWPNKPCYLNACNASVWDSFDDRNTFIDDPGSTDPLTWGTSSRDHVPWGIIDLSNDPWPRDEAPGNAYVRGGLAVMTWEYSTDLFQHVRARLLAGPAIGTADWFTTIKFRFPTTPADVGGPTFNAVEELWLNAGGISVLAAACPARPDDFVGPSIPANVWYRFKFELSTTLDLYRYKLWLDVETEPSGWDFTGSAPGGPATSFILGFTAFSDPVQSPDGSVELDWLDFNGNGPCATAIFVDPNGYGCETPVRVNDTTFQCSASMVAGSSKVTVNGHLQRPGIAREYTESTAATGTIVFADPVADGAIVEVCYYSAGPIGGG